MTKVQSLGGVSLAQAMRTRDNVPSMKGYDAQRFEAWLQKKRDAFDKELGRLAKAQEEVLQLRTEKAELVAALSHKPSTTIHEMAHDPAIYLLLSKLHLGGDAVGQKNIKKCKKWVKRSTRNTRKPRRFADEKFLPGTNNGYTAGRRIDPGFGIDGAVAPFDNWAKGYYARVNEDSRAPVYVDVEDDEVVEEDEGEEWVPSGDESEESDDEW